MSKDLLLQLPHRQFVWTIPWCLRVFLKHNRELHAELRRLIFTLLGQYFSEATGRDITTGMVSSLQTFGEYASWNPHWHTIVLEGGFDRHDKFFFIPIGASEELSELWRREVIGFFVSKGLVNANFAISLLGWRHSGFSIESGTRIYDERARESLSQYIVRAPVYLEKLYWDNETDTVVWSAPKKGLFRGEDRYFSGPDFIAQVTLHIPDKGKHLVRRYGVYFSRSRGTWKNRKALMLRAPVNWYGFAIAERPSGCETAEAGAVTVPACRKAWELSKKSVSRNSS